MTAIQIFIETCYGNVITLDVNSADTIASIKAQPLLQSVNLRRFRFNDQILQFNNIDLTDEQTLESAGIVNQSTLQLSSSMLS
jgi:hypothetical protein